MTDSQLSDRLLEALQQNIQLFSSLNDELKSQIKTLIDAQVESLGLVTRDEFEAMRISLDRSISRVEKLEAQLKNEAAR